MNLAEALPKEQERVRKLVTMYRDPMLKGAGEIAAQLMEGSLRAAERAAASGDVVSMIQAYEDLKSCTG